VNELKEFIRNGVEVYGEAKTLIQRDEFNALGLTDTGMAHLSEEAVIITVDYRLAGKIEAIGRNALNFNHYRSNLMASP
jgi:hypothetical protein